MTASCVAIPSGILTSTTSSHSVKKLSGDSATPSRDDNSYTTIFRTPTGEHTGYTGGLLSVSPLGHVRPAERCGHLPLHRHRGVDAAREAAPRALHRGPGASSSAFAGGIRAARRP